MFCTKSICKIKCLVKKQDFYFKLKNLICGYTLLNMLIFNKKIYIRKIIYMLIILMILISCKFAVFEYDKHHK